MNVDEGQQGRQWMIVDGQKAGRRNHERGRWSETRIDRKAEKLWWMKTISSNEGRAETEIKRIGSHRCWWCNYIRLQRWLGLGWLTVVRVETENFLSYQKEIPSYFLFHVCLDLLILCKLTCSEVWIYHSKNYLTQKNKHLHIFLSFHIMNRTQFLVFILIITEWHCHKHERKTIFLAFQIIWSCEEYGWWNSILMTIKRKTKDWKINLELENKNRISWKLESNKLTLTAVSRVISFPIRSTRTGRQVANSALRLSPNVDTTSPMQEMAHSLTSWNVTLEVTLWCNPTSQFVSSMRAIDASFVRSIMKMPTNWQHFESPISKIKSEGIKTETLIISKRKPEHANQFSVL